MLSPHGRRVLRISDCGLRIDCRLNPQFKSAIRIPKSALRTATVGGKDYSVVAGSLPLYAFITASIPDVVNIRLLMISDFRLQIVTSHVESIHRQVKTIRDIALDSIGCPGNGAIHNVPPA